ncbi:MAG: methylmalonyl Co-A mutase-associated GTPase MeaB [Acidobacteria bacterium]|nr:methylmalonyl Co-A mutase-associated GTPase MeaB [Acidobacteriota bacterium]
MDLDEIVGKVKARDRRTVARLISLVEDESPQLAEIVRAIGPLSGGAAIVGLTGAPGVGKSTLAAALVSEIRAEGRTVSVLAIDPTSPFTGGALLGDRLRMQDHATDPGVFIRSMATRGRLGGLAWATPHALRILDAAGADVIILETVGVGQAEVAVVHAADTAVVVLAPGMGDAVQASKAGLLEIGDVYVINKADREGARAAARDIEQMLDLGAAGEWRPPVIETVAEQGTGVGALWQAILRHREHLGRSGGLRRRRLDRAGREISEIAVASLRASIGGVGDGAVLAGLAEEVVDRRLDPYAAAEKLLGRAGGP